MNWSQFNLGRVASGDGEHGCAFDSRPSLDLGMGSNRSKSKEHKKKQVVLRRYNVNKSNLQNIIKSLQSLPDSSEKIIK